MNTKLPFDSPTDSGANRLAAAAGRIPPGLTRLAFHDAWGATPATQVPSDKTEAADDSGEKASPAHVVFSALVALASIFAVALAR